MKAEDIDAIDCQHLSAIAMGSAEMILPILENFRKSFRKEMAEFSALYSEVTNSAWAEFFHRIKGTGGTLGLTRIHQISEKFEERLRKGILPRREEMVVFYNLFENSCEQAEYFLKELAG